MGWSERTKPPWKVAWVMTALGLALGHPPVAIAETAVTPNPTPLGSATLTPEPTGPRALITAESGIGWLATPPGTSHRRTVGALHIAWRPSSAWRLNLSAAGYRDRYTEGGVSLSDRAVFTPTLQGSYHTRIANLSLAAAASVYLYGNDGIGLMDLKHLTPEIQASVAHPLMDGAWVIGLTIGTRWAREASRRLHQRSLNYQDRLSLDIPGHHTLSTHVEVRREWPRFDFQAQVGFESFLGVSTRPRLRVGLQYEFLPSWYGHLRVSAAPEQTARVGIPGSPNLSLVAGISHQIGAQSTGAPVAMSPEVPPDHAEISTPRSTVRGEISWPLDHDRPQLEVYFVSPSSTRVIEVAPDGSFAVEVDSNVAGSIQVEAEGFRSIEHAVNPAESSAIPLVFALEPRLPDGEFEIIVQSFRGQPLSAAISLESLEPTSGPRIELNTEPESGRIRRELAPGRYRLVVSALGYATQELEVQVEMNGVTLLNIDLQGAHP